MPRENDDQLDVIRSIKAEGGYAKKWSSRFIVGVPDLICALPGIGIFLLEIKTPDNDPTPKQDYELQKFREGGGLTLVGIVVRKVSLIFLTYPASQPCFWDTKQRVYVGIKRQIENHKIWKGKSMKWKTE